MISEPPEQANLPPWGEAVEFVDARSEPELNPHSCRPTNTKLRRDAGDRTGARMKPRRAWERRTFTSRAD